MPDSIDLAHIPTFRIGVVRVEPSSRSIRSDEEEIVVEPRVLQLLVALAQARGSVLSRDDLIQRVWGGRVVGENAIHRAMSRLRTIAATIGKDTFAVETVKGVGYKLIEGNAKTAEQLPGFPQVARRALVFIGLRSARRITAIAAAAAVLFVISASIILWPTGSKEPAALHIARFAVADPRDRMLADGLRQSLASTLRGTGLIKVIGLEGLPHPAADRPPRSIPAAAVTLSGRLERTGSMVRLHYDIGGTQKYRGSIDRPSSELLQLENELAGRVFAALAKGRGEWASELRERGPDYETVLIASGLTKARGRKDLLLAEELLRPIVQRHPGWSEAKLALANALYLRGPGSDVTRVGKAPLEAFRLAQQVAKARPTSGRALALMAVTSPDRRRSLEWLETAVRLEPLDAEILLFLAHAQLEMMQFERALQTSREVWELEPYWIRSSQLASIAAELGYVRMGNEIDRTLAATHPQRYQRLLAQARIEERAGQWGAALESARQALIDPDNPETGEATQMVLVLSAALVRPTGIEPRSPASAIRHSVFTGVLPDRSTLERDGVPPRSFWGLNETLLIAPALFVASGREAELVRLYDRSFADPNEMLEHMRIHTVGGPGKFASVAPYLALSLRNLGRHAEERGILELARKTLYDAKVNGRVPTSLLVDLARIEAVLGNRRAALSQLRQARAQGWPQFGQGLLPMTLTTLRDDPAFRLLAGAPEFEAADRRLAELKRG